MSTTTTDDVTRFAKVDDATATNWFIDFMDSANALPGYAGIRGLLAEGLGDVTGRTVLEAGCGTGDDALELARWVGPSGRVLGVDLSDAMVDESRRRAAGTGLPVEFRQADLAGLDLPDASVDAVRAKLVLMHCADVGAAAAELIRVLRPGGRIAVFDYDFEMTAVDHPDLATTRTVVRCAADGHVNTWAGRQLRRRLLDLGLREVAVVPHTVLLTLPFFRLSVGRRLESALGEGSLALTPQELDAWWRPLEQADTEGRFLASLTGFAVHAVK